jgi:anti-sigma factor RsiW
MRGTAQTCERARQWVSLRLDGELSELESALLEAHLARCARCGTFAADVEGATLELRSAALERFEQPIMLPVRRSGRSLRAVQLGAAAALVAAAAGLGTVFGALGSGRHEPSVQIPNTAGLLAFDSSPRGLPTNRSVALQQRPPLPIPRNLSLPDV